jgi:hypothetical protein
MNFASLYSRPRFPPGGEAAGWTEDTGGALVVLDGWMSGVETDRAEEEGWADEIAGSRVVGCADAAGGAREEDPADEIGAIDEAEVTRVIAGLPELSNDDDTGLLSLGSDDDS